MVSRYLADLQVVVMHQEMSQSTSKGGEEDNCKPVNMDVNNAIFKLFKKSPFNAFIRPHRYTQLVMGSNTEYKQLLFVNKKTLQGAFKS